MPTHRFLAFIGTNFYEEARYQFNDGISADPTRFIQVALCRRIKADLGDTPLHAHVFCTQQAVLDNWSPPDSMRTPFSKNGPRPNSVPYPGLAAELTAAGIAHDMVQIPDGKTERELWDIFNAIVAQVDEGDFLYVDVTHGFRSLPLVMSQILVYLINAKGVKVERLDYGAFDASHEVTPVFDLLPFLELNAWTEAITTFRRGGSLQALADAIEQLSNPILKARGTSVDVKKQLSTLGSSARKLDDALENCRLRDISVFADNLCTNLRQARQLANDRPQFTPLGPLLDSLISEIEPLVAERGDDHNRIQAQLRAVRYHLSRRRMQPAYTLLRETALDLLEATCRTRGLEMPDRQTADRVLFQKLLRRDDPPKSRPRNESELEVKASRLVRKLNEEHSFTGVMHQIKEDRNALNHAFTSENRPKTGDLLRRATSTAEKLEDLAAKLLLSST